jgi:hypothetical protein
MITVLLQKHCGEREQNLFLSEVLAVVLGVTSCPGPVEQVATDATCRLDILLECLLVGSYASPYQIATEIVLKQAHSHCQASSEHVSIAEIMACHCA